MTDLDLNDLERQVWPEPYGSGKTTLIQRLREAEAARDTAYSEGREDGYEAGLAAHPSIGQT